MSCSYEGIHISSEVGPFFLPALQKQFWMGENQIASKGAESSDSVIIFKGEETWQLPLLLCENSQPKSSLAAVLHAEAGGLIGSYFCFNSCFCLNCFIWVCLGSMARWFFFLGLLQTQSFLYNKWHFNIMKQIWKRLQISPLVGCSIYLI